MVSQKTLELEVTRILESIPKTRNSDMVLYSEYLISKWVRDVQFYKVFQDSEFRKTKNISVFESVSRARRKIQNERQDLRATEKVEKEREINEQDCYNYYGGKI